jgi:hypothetical protein
MASRRPEIPCEPALSETSISITAPYCWLLNSTSGIGTFFDRFALSFIMTHLAS